MVGIVEMSGAFGGIKTALDLVKGLQALKTEADINGAVIDIQRTLLEAQGAALEDRERQMELMAKIEALERKLKDIENAQVDKSRYALTEFPTGRFAYVLKDESANGEPAHRICVKCLDDGKKSVLQTVHKHSGGESVYCPTCKERLLLHPFPEVKVPRVRVRSWMDR